jgi:uncharacterized protein (DUF169 family)
MENGIITIRNWIRTNGSISEDGKSITYDCAELEKTINEALMQTAVVGQSEQLFCQGCHKWKGIEDVPEDYNCSNCRIDAK